MKWLKKLFHPLIAFIGVQLVWVLVVVSWVYWFVSRHKELRQLAERYRPEMALHGYDWLVLVEGLILLVVILVGVYVIFLYWIRQTNLYNQQRSFISQVTHELKSPLASIQLHLETIRLRKPDLDKLDRFLDTMLEDTDRLNNLISNLLMAAKLENRRYSAPYQIIDFSAFLTSFMERKQQKLPEGGSLIMEVEPGLTAAVDSESMGMALRNLFENAVLYSIASPEIKVTLQRSDERCLLTFQDSGRGIEKKNLKKVFQMFYRVRQPGDSTRGTGLGLYIVKSIVEEHGGKIKVTSEGPGRGTTFLITLPLHKQGGGGNG